MCFHMFTYYPRMNDLYTCVNLNDESAWQDFMNTTLLDHKHLKEWILNRTWTEESTIQWQNFYNRAARFVLYGRSGHFKTEILPNFPIYKDLKHEICKR